MDKQLVREVCEVSRTRSSTSTCATTGHKTKHNIKTLHLRVFLSLSYLGVLGFFFLAPQPFHIPNFPSHQSNLNLIMLRTYLLFLLYSEPPQCVVSLFRATSLSSHVCRHPASQATSQTASPCNLCPRATTLSSRVFISFYSPSTMCKRPASLAAINQPASQSASQPASHASIFTDLILTSLQARDQPGSQPANQ